MNHYNMYVFFFATIRVARLTLQTRKLWLVDVVTDRDALWLALPE